MKAKKRGIIGAVVGAIGLPAFMVFASSMQGIPQDIGSIILMFFCGALYGFGYAFGWSYVKSWIAKAFGVSTSLSLLGILFSRNWSWLKTFFVFLIVFSFAIGLAWIPGVVRGIRAIAAEA